MYKAMIKKSKNKKGFTLVELIVVMAILAILAAILIPSVSGMIRRSNESVDLAAARNLYMAGAMAYATAPPAAAVTISDLDDTDDITEVMEDFLAEWPEPKVSDNGDMFSVVIGDDGEISVYQGDTAGSGTLYDQVNGKFSS